MIICPEDASAACRQVHGRKAVVNFREHPDDIVREPKLRGACCSSADTSGPSHFGAPSTALLLWNQHACRSAPDTPRSGPPSLVHAFRPAYWTCIMW